MMYTKTIIPTKENHTVEVPEEFFGKKILVTVEPIEKEVDLSYLEKMELVEKTFASYEKVDLTNFVFDREEANNFDE